MKEEHKKKIMDSISDLLENYYPLAKKSLLDLEARERIKALGAFTDLRDVFDHFYLALEYAKNGNISETEREELVRHNITSAYEHLRRAAIEPLETAVEDLLAKIIEKAKYNFLLYPLKISNVKNEKIKAILTESIDNLSKIRQNKGKMEQLNTTLAILELEYQKLIDLEKDLPTKITTKLLLIMFGIFLIGVMFGMVFV